MQPKVVVTGADGFIGSHLAEHLVRQGYPVRALVQYNSFNSHGWLDTLPPDVLQHMEIVAGDVRDAHSTEQLVRGCEWVFHLAALIAIPYSYQAPDSYIDTNIKGTLHVLQAARRHGVARVLVTSTSEVYGTARYTPINEEHPLQGQSPYSASKIGADRLAESFYRSFDTPVTIVRPFNTYGPRQSARAVIPTIITQLLNRCETLRLGDLSPTRDLVYVADTVTGFEILARCNAAIGQEVNIATGREISIGQLARWLIDRIYPQARIEQDEQRLRPAQSEVFRLLGCNRKLQALTGWTPAYSLEQGLEATIAWFSEPAHLAAYKSFQYNI